MAVQNTFIVACILSAATVAYAQIPVSDHNGNIGNIPLVGPAVVPVRPDLEYYAYPRFNYQYHVADPITGDFKHHGEERDGPNVRGSYALLEPNGSIRHVHYIADVNGFRANVHRTPGAHVPGTGPVRAPVPAVFA